MIYCQYKIIYVYALYVQGISAETIQNCYRKTGFKTSHNILPEHIDPSIEAFDSACRQLSKHINFDKFAYQAIDDNLLFTGTLTDEEIVASVQPQQPEEEEAEQIEVIPRLTSSAPFESLKQLQHYFITLPADNSIQCKKVQSLNSSIEF